MHLNLGLAQIYPKLGDLKANLDKHLATIAQAKAEGCDLVVFPELSLTGYQVQDLVPEVAIRPLASDPTFGPLLEASRDIDVVFGFIHADTRERFSIASAYLSGGETLHIHHKIYLPTYGMFDEARWFGRGRKLTPWPLPGGWRAGVLVCEDFWHPGLVYALASTGIDVLLVMAAGPGRGAWEGGTHGDFASADAWERIARTTAQLYGIYVALANRVGVEGGVTFAGGSLVIDPAGDVIERAPSLSEATLSVTLTRAHLARARRPYFHGRDDDPLLVARELLRLHPEAAP